MTETPPPPDRHPLTKVTRLPYVVVVIVALLAAALWGAMTLRERNTAARETIGIGDEPAAAAPAATPPPR